MKNNDKINYDFTLSLRSKIYDRCRILVNDMNPVIKEIDMFIKHFLLSPLSGDSKVTYRILGMVDLYVERTNETVKEYHWSICTNQTVEHMILVIDYEGIDESFEVFKPTFMTKLSENEITDFPKVLVTGAFLCFIETLFECLPKMEIGNEVDIYGIIKIGNNGECNILI